MDAVRDAVAVGGVNGIWDTESCRELEQKMALTMNPPHILIARNSRGQNLHNPSASLSSPTETHAAAAGIFRSAGSPSWYLEECESDEMASSLSTNGDLDDPIEIDQTFICNSKFPGNVKIIVESTTFWCASPTLQV